MRGFAPARPFEKTQGKRGPFVSAKGPKTISACARPPWGSWAVTPNEMARELTPRCKVASPLKQPSPETSIRGGGPAVSNAEGYSSKGEVSATFGPTTQMPWNLRSFAHAPYRERKDSRTGRKAWLGVSVASSARIL